MIAGYPVWAVALICLGVFTAGFIDAIGGGGGLITVPTYILVGFPTHFALGTNKMSSALGTVASTVRFIRSGYVNWGLALPSIVLAATGAHFGTKLQLFVNETYLRYVLIVVLLCVAAVMFRKKELPEAAGDIDPKLQRVIVWVSALVVGMYDGFYGPGTGTFLLIAFSRLAKMDLRTASGNVKIVNLSSNSAALITSLMAGKVIIAVGLIAGVFSFAGHYIGAGMMIKNGSRIVKPVILVVLTMLFIKIVLELMGISV